VCLACAAAASLRDGSFSRRWTPKRFAVVTQRCSTLGHWQSSKGSTVVFVGGCICVS
jgi:hypothetical protein